MAAIVLAGGGGRRLGGVAKPALLVGGVRLLDRVLSALTEADPVIVVGPDTLGVPPGVVRTREVPPGGGPVAGVGAAIGTGAVTSPLVAILGGDLPLLTAADLTVLVEALTDNADGAVYVDADGREQWLCGVWRTAAIEARLRATGTLANSSLRGLFGPLAFLKVVARNTVTPPYFDCDTEDDIRRAEEWLRR
jgi:molybdopterin-guanine dinucleotide biosynthesis protein A